MARHEIKKLELCQSTVAPTLGQKQEAVEAMEETVSQLREQLEVMIGRDAEDKKLIQRYREEIKMEKTMAKSEKNMNSIC